MAEINFGAEHTDFAAVHALLTESYWCPGIGLEKVKRAAHNSSLVANVFVDGQQVGYCRLVSDRTTFAWLCDVIVHPEFHGQGIAQSMLKAVTEHPDYQGLRRWVLATKDAHSLYEKFGFELIPNPERWMIWLPSTTG